MMRRVSPAALSGASALSFGIPRRTTITQQRWNSKSSPSIEIPTLSFLSDKNCLLETVDGTVEACEALLNAIPKAKSFREKHDLLDSTSNVLCLLLDPCEFVRQMHPDEAYKRNATHAFQRGHEYMCEVNARRSLYDVLVELASPQARKELSDEENKNVAQLKRDMEGNGIHLPDAERKVITEMNVEKEELAMRFLMDQESRNPFGTLRNLIQCRYDLARKLGFESYAEQQLRGTMLENQQKVWHFLCGVTHKYRAAAEREAQLVMKYQGEVRNRSGLTDDNRAKICTSLRRDAEPEKAIEYFSVANCVRGIQCLCSEVFGVKLEQVPFAKDELFHRDAKKFLVYDEEKQFLGVIVLDMFARPTKLCQAGHLTVQLGCRPHTKVLKQVGLDLPERQYPVVVLTCNAGSDGALQQRPDGSMDDEMILMKPHEVVTCFHEFGHALHTIFGQTKVQNLAGTRGSIDFVETFSQLFEQFLTSHDFLKLWAHRINTREPISFDMVMKRNEVANMFYHLDTMDQVCLAAVDQTLHGPQPLAVYFPHGDKGHVGKRTLGDMKEYGRGMFNLAKLVMEITAPITVLTPTEGGALRTLSFEHLSTYPAGYYGYLYSLEVARRIWKKKFEHDPLNRAAGRELVDKVLRHGAACHPVELLSQYLGDDLDEIDVWG
ncbi:mitochondrial intermediate peptidase, putative [Bodo saltans]|uniref:Mitochondrial intermediate peptidase, putative n=1 Tax=Bodo saltans TaxID=75058 RepID=A0A0S4JWM4_BODSA|nr:mitochondrial intermediate peptidase, putative [Bodo saltans]|eukprot:CUG93829.1 mitochondrial intermediate peptidase, putative [Bodo saltans]